MLAALCNYPTPQFLFFSENVPTLVYYSHLPVIVIALLLGFFVYKRGENSLPNKIMFYTLMAFAAWVLLDSIFWAANRSDIIMFVWSLQVLIEPAVHAGCLYLIQVLITKKDTSPQQKVLLFALYLPIILLVPTPFILSSFDLTTCLSNETFFSYYTYVLEGIFTLWILGFAVKHYRLAKTLEKKREIAYLTFGIILFLVAFSWGAITGSFTEDWNLAQAGLIGMPIFAFFLVYSIVRYQTFNIKLIASQALVAALVILVGAQFVFTQNTTGRILTATTFLGAIIFGIFLIRSVKREIQQRKRTEELAIDLAEANEKLKGLDKLKTEFLSLASHQLRSPLTAIKGYASMLLENSFGELRDQKQREAVDRIFQSSMNLTKTVEDLLNVSKIEQGGMKYEFMELDVAKLAEEITNELSVTAQNKGLALTFETDNSKPYLISGDSNKLRQVFVNFIDNSIKYTKEGFIKVKVAKSEDKKQIVFSVTDSGMGMTPEIKAQLFQKFARAEGGKMNAGGSGLGLYLAKEIVEAHKGTVDVTSGGMGQGSTFSVTLASL